MARGENARERGAAAVEFAIVLPLLFVMLFGIVEFSVIMYDKALITSASREGARFGAVFQDPRPTCDQIDTGAVQAYQQGLVTFGGSKTITKKCFRGNTEITGTNPVCSQMGDALAVQTTFTYNYLFIPRFVATLAGRVSLPLRSTTIMRCE